MKKKLFFAVAGLNIIWLTSCISGINSSGNTGYLYASVKFPNQTFSVKFIPNNTNVINVQVEGAGLGNPIKFDLTRDNTTKLLTEVPAGEKLVKATAVDINGKALAKGENHVNIISKTFNKVELVLEAINVEPAVTPAPTSTPTFPDSETGNTNGSSPIPNPTPTVITSSNPTSIPTSVSSPGTSDCVVKIPLADFPLSKSLEQAILDAGCQVEAPTQPNSGNSGGSGGSGGDFPGNVDGSPRSQPIPINVTVQTATPIPSGITTDAQ